ncbi:VCBS repeat-containing protein [Streptomyces sp. NK08204]|uniref:FG-GAP repeat domain-containing protein n=1 Tax=Streptomyces sp. NK08204 TaxID=2873260 RepID=UPI001CED4EB7|nr:VCBS repeat-containing protein [Streptomyces sp. NK08204]
MARHAFVRRLHARRAVVAVAASAALASAFGPLDAVAAGAEQETVVPATYRSTYTGALLFDASTVRGGEGAGAQGVFHWLEGRTGVLWTRYSDGRTISAPPLGDAMIMSGTGSDVLAYRYSDRVDLWNAVDGTTSTVNVPVGQSQVGVYGSTVVTSEDLASPDGGASVKIFHLLTAGSDGTTRDVIVHGGPAGMTIGQPMRGDASGLMFRVGLDGLRMAEVDPDTGLVRSWTPVLPYGSINTLLSPDHLVMYAGNGATKAYVYTRADLSAAPAEVALDSPTGANTAYDLTVVGDWLVHRPGAGAQVTAVPIAGGDPVTVVTTSYSGGGISAAPDGTALVVGRTGADDWGIQRIRPGADGRLAVTMVKALPRPPFQIQGLSLDQGRLVEADDSVSQTRDTYGRDVAVTGTPEFGDRSNYDGTDIKLYACAPTDVGCSQVFGTAAGPTVWLNRDSGGYDRLRVNGPGAHSWWERSVPAGGRITDVSGEYVLYTTATQQYVYKIHDDAQAKVTRTPGAAALSGDVLWTAGAEPGQVTAYDLTTKKTVETLTLDSGCTPTELQALGRYLYWTCGDRAGVYDRTAKKSVPVPADEAKLGDGYVVTHDKQAGKLVLTTVAGGTPESRVIGDLPDTGVSQRDVRWTVDESGPNAAYVDDREQIHLVPSGVAQQPLRLLAPAQNAGTVTPHSVDTVPDTLTTVLLSKPASGWLLTVRSKATGKVVDISDSTAVARGELNVPWLGVDTRRDVPLPNGTYEWALSVTPADGTGAPLQLSGSVRIVKGSPVRHDHVGADGYGDLLTLSSSGWLTFQQGTGKGTFSGKVSANGWSTKTVAVPFGDLNKDLCNDVLVRMGDGSLRGYKVPCGSALSTSTPYTKLGTGWNAYNMLTSPGDLTGDGRADLLARKSSTGDVYLFAAKSDGTLAAAKKIRSAWTGYTKIVGAGDLNGDGIGDVLARDKAGTLYRYDGLGNGLLKDRVKVFTGWGASYNAIVGVGDITGDGRSDLVERDGAGNLYRNAGDGKGSFAARVKIGSGWQYYKGLF